MVPGFPKDEADTTCLPGIQRFVRSVKNYQPDYDLVVLSFEYPLEAREYTWHGIPVVAFGGKNRDRLYRYNNWRKVWLRLKKTKQERNVAGLLSFWLDECAFVAEKFAQRYRLKHFCWLQGQDARAGNRYVDWTKTNGTRLIAISDALAGEFKRNYNIRIPHVIPLGLEPGIPTIENAERDIDVLGVGSLIPLKQYDFFIDTIKMLSAKTPGIRAMICGDGPEHGKLQARIEVLGLQKNIKLAGELPNNEILRTMRRARVFLHPSSYEGFATVLNEALSAGCHAVSFCKPMQHDLAQHHVVTSNRQMKDTVEVLLRDKNLLHQPTVAYTAAQTACEVVALFGTNSTHI